MVPLKQVSLVVILSLSTCVVGVGEVFSETKSRGAKEWLGIYYGSQVPGFEVVRSEIVSVSGWQSVDKVIQSEGKQPLDAELIDMCKNGSAQGVAIVNLRSVVALGPVPGPSNAPNTYIANGMYKEVQGDCVLDAVPVSR